MGEPAATTTSNTKPSFFACYLLCSLNPRFKGRTYIGFTVNPKRRIRQHNGEITSGARQTQKRRPWEMILCVHGFPSHVHALQFEWAWQHPLKSIAVRDAASELKRRGARGQVLLLFTMLNLTEWKSMNLVVNFLSTKHQPLTKGCPSLPLQMKVKVGSLDDLPCYRFPHSELYASADEGEMEECDESDDNSTEEQIGLAKDSNATHGVERNIVQRHDNLQQVLTEIDNKATFIRRAQDDARKSKHQADSRKDKFKKCDKDAPKISCSKKCIGVVSRSKKKGRSKSNKRRSLSKEEICDSLVSETPSLCLKEVESVAAGDEPNSSPCLASFATWEAYVDAPYFASPLSWDRNEAHVEPQCTSSPQTATVAVSMPHINTQYLKGTTPMEHSLEDLSPHRTPSRSASKAEGLNEDLPSYQAESNMVKTSVVWDLSPLWPHFSHSREESLDDSMTRRTSHPESELGTGTNDGIVVNTSAVWDVSPLLSPSEHKADTQRSPREPTPCRTPPAVSIEKSNVFPTAACNASQFTPLWSPSPLPAKQNGFEIVRNADALPSKLMEECAMETNCSFILSPLSCFPILKPTCATSLSQAMIGGSLNSTEIIDLTDSPAQESYSIKKFTYV